MLNCIQAAKKKEKGRRGETGSNLVLRAQSLKEEKVLKRREWSIEVKCQMRPRG